MDDLKVDEDLDETARQVWRPRMQFTLN